MRGLFAGGVPIQFMQNGPQDRCDLVEFGAVARAQLGQSAPGFGRQPELYLTLITW